MCATDPYVANVARIIQWCGLTEALAGTGIRTAEGKGEAIVERC